MRLSRRPTFILETNVDFRLRFTQCTHSLMFGGQLTCGFISSSSLTSAASTAVAKVFLSRRVLCSTSQAASLSEYCQLLFANRRGKLQDRRARQAVACNCSAPSFDSSTMLLELTMGLLTGACSFSVHHRGHSGTTTCTQRIWQGFLTKSASICP